MDFGFLGILRLSLSKEFLLFTLPRSVFDRRSPAPLPTPLHTHTMPSARESTCARTPNRKDGDAETSGLLIFARGGAVHSAVLGSGVEKVYVATVSGGDEAKAAA